MQSPSERTLVESVKHAEGKFGGFCFGGETPEGVKVHDPLPAGTAFPNGAKAALLLTFDVEGNYGNGTGEMAREIANYERICAHLKASGVPATFNIVGKMVEEQGPQFVEWMVEADSEVASHGYVHEMNQRYGGSNVYAGHYGPEENLEQVRDGTEAINRVVPDAARGIRLPYGHFNEYSYEAIEKAGLKWSSHLGIDDWIIQGQGFGSAPFQISLGKKRYPIVEIPLDSQTYDWPIWVANEASNGTFVQAVRNYCEARDLPFDRTPDSGVAIWKSRMRETIEAQGVFAFLCHPINLTEDGPCWGDPVDEFLMPVIDHLAERQDAGDAWVCTCGQMADFYLQTMQR